MLLLCLKRKKFIVKTHISYPFLLLSIYMNILYLFQFHLSLENSLCKDYVTEKFWKVLQYNVIPVVLNGANMSNIAPKNSYIDFKDFNNSIAGEKRWH